MEDVIELTRKFNRKESVMIKKFFDLQSSDYGDKKLILFDMIKRNAKFTARKASLKLFGKYPCTSFRNLVSAYRHDLVNLVFMLETSSLTHEEKGNEKFRCRKLMTAGELFMSRKANKLGRKLLLQALNIAKRFELHAEMLIIMDYLRAADGFLHGYHAYEKYSEEIQKNLDALVYLLPARDVFFNVTLRNKFEKDKELIFNSLLKEKIPLILKQYHLTGSSHMAYYHHYLKLYYLEISKNYPAAIEEAMILKDIIKTKPALYSMLQIAATEMQVGTMRLLQGRYDEALQYSENALKGFQKGTLSEISCYDTIFLASFYQDKLEYAQVIINTVLLHPQIKSDKAYLPQWKFYQAYLFHSKGSFKDCYHALPEVSSITDKEGWLFSHKLLEIYNLTGQKLEEQAELHIRNLERQLRKKEIKENPRVNTILAILQSLVKEDFNFRETAELQKKELDLLKNSALHAWNPFGFELIRFEEWFEGNV